MQLASFVQIAGDMPRCARTPRAMWCASCDYCNGIPVQLPSDVLHLSSLTTFVCSQTAGWRMHPQVGHVKNLTGNNNTFGVRVYLTSAAQVRLQQRPPSSVRWPGACRPQRLCAARIACTHPIHTMLCTCSAMGALQPWHVDASDIVSLLCLKTARSGGRRWAESCVMLEETRTDMGQCAGVPNQPCIHHAEHALPLVLCSGWASGVSIYNRVLAERPDLLEVRELALLQAVDSCAYFGACLGCACRVS